MRNIYLENHKESPRESFTISASAKMNPYEIWHNLHPGKLIYLNIFCKWLMYSCIVLFIVYLFMFTDSVLFELVVMGLQLELFIAKLTD